MSYELAKAYVQIIPTTKGIEGELESALGGAGNSAGQTAGNKFSSGFGKAIGTVGKVAGAALVGAGTAMAAFTKSSVDAGMQFDSAMSQVAATMGTTVDEIGDLRTFAQDMGSKTAFSATEAAEALNYMALAGYDANKSMDMLPNVLNLAAAGGIDLASASDMVTDAASALGLETEETTTMVDQMAKASSKSNTSVAQLGEAFLKIGATARNLSGGTQELSTMLGVLADNGIKGAEGGTHLRNILLSLQNAAEDGTVDFGDFAVAVYDADGNMRSTVDIVKDMQKGMGDMSQEAKDAMLSGIFNKTDLAAINALLGTSDERFDELYDSIGDCTGAAQDMADTQLDNLAGDITLMQSAFEGLKIAISDGATPALRDAVKGITEIIDGIRDIVSGSEDGAAKIKRGFGKVVEGITEGLPDILKIFESITEAVTELFPELLSTVASELPGLFDKVLSMIGDLLPNLTAIIPDLITTFVSMVTELTGHLGEIIMPILKSVPDIVRALGQAIIQNLPTIISNLVSLVSEIASELPTICAEIIDYIPELVGGIASALIEAFPEIVSAVAAGVASVVGSLLGMGDAAQEAIDKLQEHSDATADYIGSLTTLAPQIENINGILSSQGHTIGEIDSAMSTAESNITSTIATALQEQRGLRDEELESIRGYLDELNALQEEKLGIYAQRQTAIMEKIKQEGSQISQETAFQYIADQQEWTSEGIRTAEEYYTSQLTLIENNNQAGLYSSQAAYEQAKADAKAYHDSQIAELQGNLTNTLNMVQTSADSWVSTEGSKWATLASAMEGFEGQSSNILAQMAREWNGSQKNYSDMLSRMDTDSAAAWLSIQAQTVASGGEISEETRQLAADMLESFDNLPEDMDAIGKSTLLGMTNGLENQIPALKNKANMSANEIVNAIRNTLGIHSPSTVLRTAGVNAAQGLVNGIDSQVSAVSGAARSIARSAVSGASGYEGQMYSIGAYMGDGIAEGLWSRSGYISSIAASAVSSAVSAAKSAGRISSPSRVMEDEVGAMLGAGIALGISESEDMVVGAVNDINDEMMKAVIPAYGPGMVSDISSESSRYWTAGSPAANVVGGYGPVTINVYGAEGQNVSALADEVIDRLQMVLINSEATYA